ncbi:anhydro-N-acetylmuramic acid kinase [Falsochrobactrum shanghaiense]|uniref:Anhydro-N-acetylmuramic acid kinase n=1 Tax=Falsochrobactrum shanghaiense TaxID=2201899 RepID=A0A316J9S5_9HYPH|nr:anhydro-N-acetylmuramic acid kinase [Falsochrobactrum shanghaiense]PWL17978.1 anhydro-N-acetylmuramic acid kinase [Falsochrobactrum shanghaiense]
MSNLKRAIGLMSGTSMDGIDIALLTTDGENRIERGPSVSMPYSDGFRARLKAALLDARSISQRIDRPGVLRRLERDLTLLHVVAVNDFLHEYGLKPEEIDMIGFHGQTVLHRPHEALTIQLGDGALLASETGIPVIYDMRAEDMRHGGQGAPLIPAYHAALAENLPAGLDRPVVFVNIGGISNLTCVGEGGALIAYDSGPGNMLIDQWMEMHGQGSFDSGGAIAMTGHVNANIANRYLDHEFFTSPHRRSLDRADFSVPAKEEMSLADGARTLAFVSAAAILRSASHLPSAPRSYVISGGGRKNQAIMSELSALAEREDARVVDADHAGFDGDAMEAEAWAYLAVRSLHGLPLTYPSTTGCNMPVSGGIIARP